MEYEFEDEEDSNPLSSISIKEFIISIREQQIKLLGSEKLYERIDVRN